MQALIIGGGPAGVSAALYARRGGADVTVVARDAGALAAAACVENYYGMPAPLSGPELARRGIEGARRLGVAFAEDEVLGLRCGAAGRGFVAEGKRAAYAGDALILAAGAARTTRAVPGVEEFTGHGVSYCAVCDACFYRGKTVAVVGAGAYALHEAEALLPHAAQVMLLTDGAACAAAPPPEIRVHTARIARLEGERRLARVVFADGTALDTAGVFIAIGTAGSTDLARKIGVLLHEGNIAVNAHMETNVPGVYAAGDCTGGLLQIVKAAYEGAEAGLAAVRSLRAAQP